MLKQRSEKPVLRDLSISDEEVISTQLGILELQDQELQQQDRLLEELRRDLGETSKELAAAKALLGGWRWLSRILAKIMR